LIGCGRSRFNAGKNDEGAAGLRRGPF